MVFVQEILKRKFQNSVVIITTENKEELEKKYEKMMELMKQAQEKSNGRCISLDLLVF